MRSSGFARVRERLGGPSVHQSLSTQTRCRRGTVSVRGCPGGKGLERVTSFRHRPDRSLITPLMDCELLIVNDDHPTLTTKTQPRFCEENGRVSEFQLSFFVALTPSAAPRPRPDARTMVRKRYTKTNKITTTVPASTTATSPASPTGTRSVCARTDAARGIETSAFPSLASMPISAGARSTTSRSASGTCVRFAVRREGVRMLST